MICWRGSAARIDGMADCPLETFDFPADPDAKWCTIDAMAAHAAVVQDLDLDDRRNRILRRIAQFIERIFTEARSHPAQAANELAVKILTGGSCRCGETVGLFGAPGCQWQLVDDRWEPGCDAPPIDMSGVGVERGDLVGMNRAARRRAKRKRKR